LQEVTFTFLICIKQQAFILQLPQILQMSLVTLGKEKKKKTERKKGQKRSESERKR
jgi:hypothetical protein